MKIEKYEYAKKLSEYQEDLISVKIDAQTYLNRSLTLYDKSLLGHFGSDLKFHQIISTEKRIGWSSYIITKINSRTQGDMAEKCVEIAAKLATEEVATSISDLVVSKMKNGVVLYKGDLPQQDHLVDFTTLNLGNLSDNGHSLFDERYELTDSNGGLANFQQTFEIKEIQKMQRMLGCYWRYSQNYAAQYIYFIRPLVKHDTFNGVWLLILDRPLEDDEYLELIMILQKILSETAIVKIEQYAKEGERILMVDELAHSNKHEILAAETAIAEIDIYKKQEKEDLYLNAFNVSKTRIGMMREVNDFYLCLMRAGDKGEKYHELKGRFKEKMSKEWVVLQTKLLLVLEKIRYSFQGLEYSMDEHGDLVFHEVLPKLVAKIENLLPNMRVHVIPTALEIVLMDMVKNMLVHTDSETPFVDVYIQKREGGVSLHFVNNVKMNKDAAAFFANNGEKQIEGWNKSISNFHAGLRAVKRIIRFPYFSNAQWQTGKKIHECDSITDLFFFIPNNCIKF